MKMMLGFLMALLVSNRVADNRAIDDIAVFLKQGNSHELAKLFSRSIELTLLGDDNLYAKSQAEVVLSKFFREHSPKSVKTLHKINSSPAYLFEVFILITGNGAYRVACTVKNEAGTAMIIEMRIDPLKQ